MAVSLREFSGSAQEHSENVADWTMSSGREESALGVPAVVTYNPPPTPFVDVHLSKDTFEGDAPSILSLPFVPRSAYTAPPLDEEEHEEKDVADEMVAVAEFPINER